MAGSRIPQPNLVPGVPVPRNPGPLGTNADGGDPETAAWFVGDTPGPLGVKDYADPDSPMRRFMVARSSPVVPVIAKKSQGRETNPVGGKDQKPAIRHIASPDLAKSVNEAEQRLKQLNEDERALTAEIDKVRQDIEAWEDVRKWFETESATREVSPKESNDQFNLKRWGGTGIKVGGIDTNKDGDVVLTESFAASHPGIVIEGYNRHEQIHKNNFNRMGTFEATWGYVMHGHQSWVTDRHIADELEAHRTQKEFYEDTLIKVAPQKADVEKRLKELRAK